VLEDPIEIQHERILSPLIGRRRHQQVVVGGVAVTHRRHYRERDGLAVTRASRASSPNPGSPMRAEMGASWIGLAAEQYTR
jgi:hypothetical protein